jgi:hypothetical protein
MINLETKRHDDEYGTGAGSIGHFESIIASDREQKALSMHLAWGIGLT